MTDVKVPALPDEYEAMFNDTVKDIKEIIMKIREEKKSKFMVPGYNIPSGGSGGRARETVDMIVPANKAGLIIGSHGDTLRRIEKQAQVKMQFDQQWQGGENERRVIITGFPEDIEEARRLIVEKITEERDYKNKNYDSIQLMIHNSKIGLIIGRGGETVKDLQERSGAKVFVNQDAKVDSNSNEKPVTISGDAEAIRLAQAMINEILSGGPPGSYASLAGGRPTLTIQIPEAAIGSVMGKRAEILKSIISASGGIKIFIEHSNISGTSNREVQFTGPMEHCNYAAYLVQERVNAYYNGSGTGESYSAYGSVAASNEAYASYTDPSAASSYDYSQYYAAQAAQQQQQQGTAEMDPAAVAAYYAQYYAAAQAYDPNSAAAQYNYPPAAPSDPSNNS